MAVLDKRHKNNILIELHNQHIESGYITDAERYIEKYNLNPTKEKMLRWLFDIFFENLYSEKIHKCIGILKLFREYEVEYSNCFPFLQGMAVACLVSENFELIDEGLNVFDCWEDDRSVNILEKFSLNDIWYDNCRKKIIVDLKSRIDKRKNYYVRYRP